MKKWKNPSKSSIFSPSRIVFQNIGSTEIAGGNKQQVSLQPLESGKLTPINENVAKTVKESFLSRRELQDQLKDSLAIIQKEQLSYKQVIDSLKQKQTAAPSAEISESFDCLGQTITVKMSSDYNYEAFIDSKPINFLTWAKDQKTK